MISDHQLLIQKDSSPSGNLVAEVEVNKADPRKLVAGKTQGAETTVESPAQGRGESLVAQLDSAVNQAEQLRDQQVQQQYSDQLGVYVQEKAEQIDRLQSSLAAALTSEQAQLQAIQQKAPGAGPPAKERMLNGSSRLRDERPGSRRSPFAWTG
jgi:hypothetical protein